MKKEVKNAIEYYELLGLIQIVSRKVEKINEKRYDHFKKKYSDLDTFQKNIDKQLKNLKNILGHP